MKLTIINELLDNQISKNSISHSYIFHGNKGTKKFLTALDFSKKLTNSKDPTNDVNTYIIDKDKILKEDILNMLLEFSKSSLNSNKRVIIINNAEILNQASQNSLLKFIEEPPANVHVILATSNINNILETIKSRCFLINFSENLNSDFEYNFTNDSELLKYLTNDYSEAETLFKSEEFTKLKELAKNYYTNRRDALYNNYKQKILNKDNFELFLNILLFVSFSKVKEDNNIVKNIEYINSCKEKLKYNVNTDLLIDLLFTEK